MTRKKILTLIEDYPDEPYNHDALCIVCRKEKSCMVEEIVIEKNRNQEKRKFVYFCSECFLKR